MDIKQLNANVVLVDKQLIIHLMPLGSEPVRYVVRVEDKDIDLLRKALEKLGGTYAAT